MVFLASKLSAPKQVQVATLGELLGGRLADTFSGLGSVCVVQKYHLRGVRGGAFNFLYFSSKAHWNTGCLF